MAVAVIECTCSICGKKFRHRQKCCNRASAKSYEEWAENTIDVCPECYGETCRKAEYEKACLETDALPELEGSEKQIEWAIVIRAEMLRKNLFAQLIIKHIDKLQELMDAVEAGRETAAASKIRLADEAIKIFTESSAKWFIENRD